MTSILAKGDQTYRIVDFTRRLLPTALRSPLFRAAQQLGLLRTYRETRAKLLADLARRSRPLFIGCSLDRNFVDLTCAMLSSLDDNGSTPGAAILVADFDLNDDDRARLRSSAGSLGPAMQFFSLSKNSPEIVALPQYDFPLPLLGRVVLPRKINLPNALLVTLDSDMIVNASLEELFYTDIETCTLAAVLDPMTEPELAARGRKLNPNYFNAGLMLIDVDRFVSGGIDHAVMRRLASYKDRPLYLEQDALNDVIGANWHRLDRRWNFFHAGEPHDFTLSDYEAAFIIHYAGCKPTDRSHPASSVFWRYADRAKSSPYDGRAQLHAPV